MPKTLPTLPTLPTQLTQPTPPTQPTQPSLPKGHASCLGTGFRYTPASHTDLAKTFARIRKQARARKPADGGNVRSLPIRKLG